jgi:hypothetical protein
MLDKQGYTRASVCTLPRTRSPFHPLLPSPSPPPHTHTHTCVILIAVSQNNDFSNPPHCYVIRASPVLFILRRIHLKCPLFLSNFNQIWIFSTYFRENTQISNFTKTFQWGPCCYMRTDGRTEANSRLRNLGTRLKMHHFYPRNTTSSQSLRRSSWSKAEFSVVLLHDGLADCTLICFAMKLGFVWIETWTLKKETGTAGPIIVWTVNFHGNITHILPTFFFFFFLYFKDMTS